jgi:hypothetical protein
MYIDMWTIPIFACLFGVCAWWNRRGGAMEGIEFTVNFLADKGLLTMSGDKVLKRMGFDVEAKEKN